MRTMASTWARAHFPHGDDAVLVGVEHLPHLAHGLGVGDGRGEVAVPVQAPEQAPPPVVAVCSVGQAPWHQGLPLRSACASLIEVCMLTALGMVWWYLLVSMWLVAHQRLRWLQT